MGGFLSTPLVVMVLWGGPDYSPGCDGIVVVPVYAAGCEGMVGGLVYAPGCDGMVGGVCLRPWL